MVGTITKVCRLAWDYPVRGESTFGLQPVFVNLSEEQTKQGYEVHVIARQWKAEPRLEYLKGVSVHRVPAPFTVNALRVMRNLMKPEKGWVVHTHSTCGFFLFPLKKFRRFPLVCQVHGTSRSHHVPIRYRHGKVVFDYKPLSVAYNMLRERLLWSSGDRILTVSNAIKEDVVGYYGMNPDSVNVVYNGVDASLFCPSENSPVPRNIEHLRGKSVILFVGHFGLRKGLFHLLSAMAIIRKEVPESHLLCIGGVPKWLGAGDHWSFLRSEIKKQGLEDDVTLMDAVRNSELPSYYRFAKLLALPSYYESFSKVAVEAMACGLPVVATRAGGLLEVVSDKRTGILVEYGAVPELASATIRLLQNEEEAKRLGNEGRRRAEGMFTWEAVADRVKSAYDSLPS